MMMEPIRVILAIALASGFLAVPKQILAGDTPTSIGEILAGGHRSAEHKHRDVYRHPLETLAFFEVSNALTVIEIWPGGAGWYTEILAPLLKNKGKLYAAHFPPNSDVPYFVKNLAKFKQKMADDPDTYGKIALTALQPPKQVEIAPPESAHRVLTFRNVHNWMRDGQTPSVFEAMYRALKPGGILGVVEHRGKPGIKQDPKAESGYVSEEYVISIAEKVGFELLGKSEINANPKDRKDYPEGVWTLPPSLRLEDKDRDKYVRIGESDRMTLKFLKPVSSN